MVKELITDVEELSKSRLFNARENLELVKQISQDMYNTLDSLPESRLYLCSNEIGYKERAICLRFKDGNRIYFNPAFQKTDKIYICREKDIVSGEEFFIPRFAEVELVYQDFWGNVKAEKLNEAGSTIICQAMDRLDGLSASAYGLPVLEGFDDLSDEEKSEILMSYIEDIKNSADTLDKDLSEDKDTKEIWKASKYIKSVSDGTTKLDHQLSNNEKKKIKRLTKKIKSQKNRNKFWDKIYRRKDSNGNSESN